MLLRRRVNLQAFPGHLAFLFTADERCHYDFVRLLTRSAGSIVPAIKCVLLTNILTKCLLWCTAIERS